MEKVPMTSAGDKMLQDELKERTAVERPRIVEAIAEARAHGDLSENAEYHAAREQQGFIEGRIRELEHKLSLAQVVDVTAIDHTGKVIFGTTVELINLDTEATVSYKIVGDDEANIKAGKISVNSPIARALIGKEEGEIAAVDTPGGLIEYEIAEVQHI